MMATMGPATTATNTWEILSRLSQSSTSTASTNRKHDLPFFAQREEKEKEEEDATSASADTDGGDDISDDHGDNGNGVATQQRGLGDDALFLTACPISHRVNNDNVRFPAVYSRAAITREFLNILRINGGRVSTSEMCTWLGMDEESVSLVGSWLCRNSRLTTQQQQRPANTALLLVSSYGEEVCKVYNPVRQCQEYAMVENLGSRLCERIAWHCNSCILSSSSPITSCGEYCPSLEAMTTQKVNLLPSSNKNVNELTLIATVTIKKLAGETELTCEDVSWLILLEEKADANVDGSITLRKSKSGEAVEVYNNGEVGDRARFLEKQVLSALSGVTVPTSVRSNVHSHES